MGVKLAEKGTATPVLTDHASGIDDPGGTPLVRNFLFSAIKTLFQDNWNGPVEEGFALSDETTALTTGTKLTVRLPYAMTLTGVFASVTTAPTGSTIIVDIQEGGVSVFSTKLTIDAGEESSDTATPAVISDSAIAQYAEITFIIDQIGSSTAGAGLKVWLSGTRA